MFASQGRSGSNLQSENGCCSVDPMQRECSAAFTWRLMDFSTADGREEGGGRIRPATVHLANLVALQHNLRAEYRAAGKSLSGTAEQTGAPVQALSESIILGRTTPVHASALQQLQWSFCESLEQMLWATHGMHFHVPAHTFRSLTDAQAAESWQLMSAKRQGHSRKTFFPLLSLKRPRPYNHFVFPFLTDSSVALWPSQSLCPWAEYIVGRSHTTTLSNCFKKQIGTQLFHRANHTFPGICSVKTQHRWPKQCCFLYTFLNSHIFQLFIKCTFLYSTSLDSYLKSTAASAKDWWVFVRAAQKTIESRDVLLSLLDHPVQ